MNLRDKVKGECGGRNEKERGRGRVVNLRDKVKGECGRRNEKERGGG